MTSSSKKKKREEEEKKEKEIIINKTNKQTNKKAYPEYALWLSTFFSFSFLNKLFAA